MNTPVSMRILGKARVLVMTLALAAAVGGCSGGAAEPLSDTGGSGPEVSATPESPEVGDGGRALPVADPEPESSQTGLGGGEPLRVGIKYYQPGLGYMDPETGVPSGIDVDVAAYVAWKLGYSPYDIEWVNTPSKERENYLENDVVDMVVGTFSITPERAARVDFAGPYLITGQNIAVRANDKSINSLDDLVGKSICTATGSTSLKRITALVGHIVDVVEEDDYDTCMQHLVDGQVDAVTTDDVILAGLAATEQYYRLVRLLDESFSEERYGIGLPKGSHQMCLEINNALIEMVEDGSWIKFVDRHVSGTNYNEKLYDNPPTPDDCE